MKTSRRILLSFPVALLASVLLTLGFSAPATAADYTVEQRKEYFDSGKYQQDLTFVAQRARNYIIKRTRKTLPVVRACKRAGFRVGRKDRGPAPNADYRIPVTVPKNQEPKRADVAAPSPGPGPANGTPGVNSVNRKVKRLKRVTRKRCRNTQKLAIALDMDETMMSSLRYGSPQPNYDFTSFYRNLVMGSQTALKPTLNLFNLAKRRGAVPFVITARYNPLQSDPLVGQILGGADLCDPALAGFGGCGIDFKAFDFEKVTRGNLADVGYRGYAGLYMRPPESSGLTGTVKNSQRAEISNRRGYRIIAMFGDQPTDLEGGFYERGFKFQSPEGSDD